MTSFSAVCWDTDGNCYTGGANSLIYKWNAEERSCVGTIKAHTKGFVCSLTFQDGKLYSGGKDGFVHEIDVGSMESANSWDFGNLVRAVDVKDGNLLVGLRNGDIWLRPCGGGEGKAIMSSHCDGEIWGLDSCGGKIITSGDDNQVIVWDPAKRCKEAGYIVSTESVRAKRGGASTLS